MTLWIGSEIDADVADSFREIRKRVESAINRVITEKSYDLPLTGWDCIAIIRVDEEFKERVRYSRKTHEMDFRLRLSHTEFKFANSDIREAMLFLMLNRSLDLLARYCPPHALQLLRNDLLSVQERDLQTRNT